MKKIVSILSISLFTTAFLTSQEALKSVEEEYYDFLSLQGLVERPTLNYRTLSDSEWIFNKDDEGNSLFDSELNIWKENNLGTKKTIYESDTEATNWFTKGINRSVKYKIYGPEWFNSYNTAAPYGQNDGGLWQGKGYNTSLTGGARIEAYGFEVTVKPQLSFSQNLEFDYIKPNYEGENFKDKADTYGYYGVKNIDAPQRFGDTAFFNFDWGDTEIRYTWKNFTTGFGTQSIWLGPAQLNPIIHSNNAPSYPKIDIGIRKTNIFMPYFGWYLGDIEARAWWGKLTESEYFDNDDSNDENLLAGLSLAYAFPGIFEGLTVGFDRTALSKWNEKSMYGFTRIFVPNMHGGNDAMDQRFSMTFDYIVPKVGWELYLEWARDDFSPNKDFLIRYPFHTQAWTFGTQKVFKISEKYSLKLLLEITSLENSADYDRLLNWYNTFYCHGEIAQGYTNRGQLLGAGIGTGGNSQYLGFTLIHPKGSFTLFGQRRNPDLDYTMYIDAKNDAENIKNGTFNAEKNIRANVDFGLSSIYFVKPDLRLSGTFILDWEHNPLNVNEHYGISTYRYNCIFQAGIKHSF